jgi:broad specificity phosphatase PhoE
LVVSSDLVRAHNTALATGYPVDVRKAWREIDVGRWEGLTRAEVAERYPEEVAAAMRGDHVKIGGAESWADLSDRVYAAMLTLVRELPPGARVAVFAHGGVIASLVSGVLGLREHRPRPIGRISNTAISRLQLFMDSAHQAPTHARLLAFNDASHAFSVPAWASEMQRAGHTLTTLIADGSALPDPTWAGADGDTMPVTRVVGASDAARGLADSLRVPFEALSATLDRSHEQLFTHVPGEGRRAVVLPAEDIARLVGERMRHTSDSPSSVAAPAPGSVTNVVTTPKGHTFADIASVRTEA